jgi:signal transduction histidine kinase
MDIRLVIRKAVFYVGMGIFVVGAYYLVAWSDYTSFDGPFTLGALLTAIIFAPLFLAGFVFVSRKLKQLSNKYFFASLYDYQETLDKFSRDVSSTINLPEVANVVVDTIQQTMRMDNIGLFVKNKHYEPMKVIGFDEADLQKIVSNPRCSSFIASIRKPLVYDELVRNAKNFENPKEEIEYVREQMKNMGVAVVLPLVTKGELISCIILGKKISRDAYTQEDMKLLESLANHASISIENARLYNEIQGFNETLKYKVDDATKRLRELLKIKSDFLTVASHQLRTPTSIVRGMLSLVIEEKDLPNDERERFISQAYEGINRLERIIHELLNATELEGKKMQLDSKKVRVEDIIEEIIYGLQPLVNQLKVNLTFNKPSKPMPKTVADPIKLKEAITNIVDNAVHYTAGGDVNILARRKENQIVIEVSDNGIGMTKNDLRNIFTKFTRGEGILQVHPNGTGLGLFIARKMLEAMGGTITAESKGKNKGSKFTLTIPIK